MNELFERHIFYTLDLHYVTATINNNKMTLNDIKMILYLNYSRY